MNKLAIKKTIIFLMTISFVFTLTSCGKFSRLRDELEMLTVDAAFPSAESTAVESDEAEDAVRAQQVALAYAYSEAYKLTETNKYELKYEGIEKDKLTSELSSARSRINYDNELLFEDNMKTILQDVTDIPNQKAYISKRVEEVKAFYRDYIKFQDYTEEDFEEVTALLVKYYSTDNEFAKWALVEKELFVVECATLSIENNSEVSEGHSASLQRNNEIITSINKLFGGVRGDTKYAARITKANKKLSSHITEVARYKQEQLKELETE